MTKVISLQHNYNEPYTVTQDWHITVNESGNYFSGPPDVLYKVFESFISEKETAEETIKRLEKEYNVSITTHLAMDKGGVDKENLFQCNENEIIINTGTKKNTLFERYEILPNDIAEFWRENNNIEQSQNTLLFMNQLSKEFYDNISYALAIELSSHGELEDTYLDDLEKAFEDINAYDLIAYNNYIGRANPKETFKFVGLQL